MATENSMQDVTQTSRNTTVGVEQLGDSDRTPSRLWSRATNVNGKPGVRALASAFDALAIQAIQKSSRTNNIQLNTVKSLQFNRNIASASSMPHIKSIAPTSAVTAINTTGSRQPVPATVAQILTLQSLVPELHILIFEVLTPNRSACLGLTCKQFYAHHRATHGKVPLHDAVETDTQLHELLHPWFGFDLYFYQGCGMFVTLERFTVKLGEEIERSKEKHQRALDGTTRTGDELNAILIVLRRIVAALPNHLQMPAGNA